MDTEHADIKINTVEDVPVEETEGEEGVEVETEEPEEEVGSEESWDLGTPMASFEECESCSA